MGAQEASTETPPDGGGRLRPIIPQGYSVPFWVATLCHTLLAGAFALVLVPASAGAQPTAGPESPVRFRVVIDAPRALESMLEGGLDLMRWQQDDKVTSELLHRLIVEARLEVERAVAAEGYFSPTVRSLIE